MRPPVRAILVAAACIFLSLVSPAFGGETEPPRLEILSPAKVDVSADEETTVTVFVRNAGPLPVVVSFQVHGEYAPTVRPESAEVFGQSVRKLELTFVPDTTEEPVSGVLIASGRGRVPASAEFEASAEQETPGWVYAIIFGSLGLASALVVIRWLVGGFPRELGGRLGPASWDFSKSWGSTLTAVGALLGTILSASVLPDTTSVPKATYAGLNLFFGALIVIGPFAYTATQGIKPVHRTRTVKEPQFQGYVWSFLLATAITLWAVLGELATMFAVFDEIQVGQTMPEVALGIFAALLAISGVLLLVMSWKRIKTIIEFQRDLPAQRRKQLETHPRFAGLAVEEAPDAELLEPELPSWPVL